MPLTSGIGSVKSNMEELTTGKVGSSRRRAIKTLAKKWGISEEEARIKQAFIISKQKLEAPKKKAKSLSVSQKLAI